MATTITPNSDEELIICRICHESFNDPRLLPCSHTFCRRCIEQMASDNNDQFVCPLHDQILVERSDIDSLPLNQDARGLVELYGELS